jgi:DNA uptake protein ComE-like DNA-binding protein
MKWKDLFYFSRRERQGIVLLLVLVAGVFLGKWLFADNDARKGTPVYETESHTSTSNSPAETNYTPLFQQHSKPTYKKEYRSSSDEKRTYYAPKEEQQTYTKTETPPKQEKFAAGTVIELNAADSTALMHIPGVGASFAKRIIGYRNMLGGYHRVEQLQEVYGMYEELYIKIVPFLNIDANQVERIKVNAASVDKLKAHPYFNFYQAKVLVELRKKKGKLTGTDELQLLEEFTPDDWVRITPYLDFE